MNRRALIQPAGRAFPYFGHKSRNVNLYPVPKYDHIIEPFAGGAGYALRYPELKVTLYDLDEDVCLLWDYLINASYSDILNIPLVQPEQKLSDLNLEEGPRHLVARWLNPLVGRLANNYPPMIIKHHYKDGSFDAQCWGKQRRAKVANLVSRIKHWQIFNKSYVDVKNERASWFIDPPYASKVSKAYSCTHESINYEGLSSWCRDRKGQTIVCENTDSPKWLPFRDLVDMKGGCHIDGKLKRSTEVIWCSDEQDYPMQQQSLL